mmetsp:Transcript_14183/g.61755  ORF Transcript_14183/g.61755 Transcript_14183/m.61755 type:complete len:429 (+) Transcript_14183:133-1419(+)
MPQLPNPPSTRSNDRLIGLSSSRRLRRLLLILLHDDRVDERAQDGNRGGHLAEGRDGVLEHGDRGKDDDDSLDGVRHGMAERGELAQRLVGGLVVEVVEHGSDDEVGHETRVPDAEKQRALRGHQRGCRGEGGAHLRALDEERQGQEHDAGDNSDTSVQIDALETSVRLQVLRGGRAQGGGDVGGHGAEERRHGKVDLGGGTDGDASHDGDEREPNPPGVLATEEHRQQEHGDRGLASLDHLHERHGAKLVRRASGDVRDHVVEGGWDERLEHILREATLRWLEDAKLPHDEHEHRSDRDLNPGEDPGVREHGEGLLVHDGEDGVQEVPAEDVKRNLEGLGHVLLRGLGSLDGGSRGGLRLDDHPGRAGCDRSNGAPGEADRSRGEEGGTGEANFPGRRRGWHHGLSTDDGGLLGRRRRAGERHSPEA